MTTVDEPTISYLTVGRANYYRANMNANYAEVSFVHDGLYDSHARAYLGAGQVFNPAHHTLLVEAKTGCDNRPAGRIDVYARDIATAQYAHEVLSQLAAKIADLEGGLATSASVSTLDVFVECLQRRIDGQAWSVLTPDGTRVLSQFLTAEQAYDAITSGDEDPQGLLAAEGDKSGVTVELRHADPDIPINGARWSEPEHGHSQPRPEDP